MNAMFTESCLAGGALFTEKRQMNRRSGQSDATPALLERRRTLTAAAPGGSRCIGELSCRGDAERRMTRCYRLCTTLCKQNGPDDARQ